MEQKQIDWADWIKKQEENVRLPKRKTQTPTSVPPPGVEVTPPAELTDMSDKAVKEWLKLTQSYVRIISEGIFRNVGEIRHELDNVRREVQECQVAYRVVSFKLALMDEFLSNVPGYLESQAKTMEVPDVTGIDIREGTIEEVK